MDLLGVESPFGNQTESPFETIPRCLNDNDIFFLYKTSSKFKQLIKNNMQKRY